MFNDESKKKKKIQKQFNASLQIIKRIYLRLTTFSGFGIKILVILIRENIPNIKLVGI